MWAELQGRVDVMTKASGAERRDLARVPDKVIAGRRNRDRDGATAEASMAADVQWGQPIKLETELN
jgi:hypothetical protein